eukprot:374057_1
MSTQIANATNKSTSHSSSTTSTRAPGSAAPTRRFSEANGYYSPEGTKTNYYSNTPLSYENISTDSLYNQLKTHTELALRVSAEVLSRRKEELANFKQEYTKKIEELKSIQDKQLKKQHESQQRDLGRIKQETESKVKNLEIQLAERVAAQNAMEKSNKEKFDSLNSQITEKNLRINKIETDYEDLQRKYTEL